MSPISDVTAPVEIAERLARIARSEDWGVAVAAELLAEAWRRGWSDLHVMCQRDVVLVRARLEGELFPVATLPVELRDLLVSRFKVLARLPAFNKSEPQEGRIDFTPAGSESPVPLRASFLPTVHGQNLVLRFPGRQRAPLQLEDLGMAPPVLAATERLLALREGLILLTGPSGSGKTTTLYALLQSLFSRWQHRFHFLTIEDPVERVLPFAAQVQVNEAQGIDFAKALRSGLRQDPNVILIGEIRDQATARVAVQAGMTGHLVLSTLHAGRVARVFARLLAMGLEPYQASSALAGAMAQRLFRRREPDEKGNGRLAVFEAVLVNEPLRRLMLQRADASAIEHEAIRIKVGDLFADARELVTSGIIKEAEYQFILGQEEGEA
jgi:general secretion pathway protein E